MTKYKLILVALLFPSFIFAQESQSFSLNKLVLLTDIVKLNEIIIDASKTDYNLQEITVATSYIPSQEIRITMPFILKHSETLMFKLENLYSTTFLYTSIFKNIMID